VISIIRFWVLLGSCFSIGSEMLAAGTPLQLRVLTYNIHHGEGTDGKVDLERIAKVISAQQPDLVALQEVDNRTWRTGGVDQTSELAKLTKLQGRFAKQIDYEGGEYGQAILSKHPIDDLKVHVLPGRPEREQRIAGVATINVNDIKLSFATTHLHHARGDLRLEQAVELNRLFQSQAQPSIVVGDMNAVPDEATTVELAKQWLLTRGEHEGATKLWTYPSIHPAKQLDYIAARPIAAWRIVEVRVVEEELASDHRPLLAVLELIAPYDKPHGD